MVLTRCPVCKGALTVARLSCRGCGTAIEGRFHLGWLERLSAEQLAFVRVFLECRGKIKDVEQALGLSYPTVVARLEETLNALRAEPPAPAAPDRSTQRKQILDELASGAIDATTAAERLRGL